MEISLSIESREGLTWPHWKRLTKEIENWNYAGLFRSDHLPGDNAALELIVSLAYLADHTQRIHFGPLIAPISFHDLSGGRLILGLGAGWLKLEHQSWGYDLGDRHIRSTRFEEGLEVITQLLRNDEQVSFEGQYFRLREARMLPRPERSGGHPSWSGAMGPDERCRWSFAMPTSGTCFTSRRSASSSDQRPLIVCWIKLDDSPMRSSGP